MPSEIPTKQNQSYSNLKRNISRTRTTSTSEKDGTVHIKGSKTIYTAGRPPWYDSSGQMKEALVIGLCGGSASGIRYKDKIFLKNIIFWFNKMIYR